MPHFLQVLLTWQCNVRGNWSKTQGQRHVRLFIESLPSSGRSYHMHRLCCRMFRRDSRVRRIKKVQTRKKLGGNFLFPAPPPFSPAFLFRIFHTFALSPLSESMEKASAELAKGWKGKMYFKVGPRRLLEERLWKIHGHNIFFWEYRSPYMENITTHRKKE